MLLKVEIGILIIDMKMLIMIYQLYFEISITKAFDLLFWVVRNFVKNKPTKYNHEYEKAL
jgi:hypothetical protein